MANSTTVSLRDIGGGFVFFRHEEEKRLQQARSSGLFDEYRPPKRSVPLEELLSDGLPAGEPQPVRRQSATGRASGVSIAQALFHNTRSMSLPSRQQTVRLNIGKRGTSSSASKNKGGVDCAFGALSESNWSVSQLIHGSRPRLGSQERHQIFTLSAAKLQSSNNQNSGDFGSTFRSIFGCFRTAKVKVAQRVAGNVETVVICNSKLEAVDNGVIIGSVGKEGGCGRNPLKCFVGQKFEAACGRVHFVLMGAHFPIRGIGAAMQDFSIPTSVALERIKAHVSMMLQKILQIVHEQGQLTPDTILILQGDLNSRTVLSGGKVTDVLCNTLNCPESQEIINSILPPELRGEWREVVDVPEPCLLPVTYRFNEKSKHSHVPPSGLPLRDIFGDSRNTQPRLCMKHTGLAGNDHYKQVYENMGDSLDDYGLWRPEKDKPFKPYRIPSCTDRVIFYAPKALQDRCTWECPRGYEVNYRQLGSDHKPVLVESTLRISQCGLPEMEKE